MRRRHLIFGAVALVVLAFVFGTVSRNDRSTLIDNTRFVRIVFIGDVMCHMPQVTQAMREDGAFDFSPTFRNVKSLFSQADLVVANLETTLSSSGDYSGYPCFCSPIALAEAIHSAGVDVALMANNHVLDRGKRGVQRTIAALDSIGLMHTGVYADTLAHHPLVVERNGLRVAIVNHTYSTNGIATPEGICVNRIDTLSILSDLEWARRNADCTITCMHWGNEYSLTENEYQRKVCKFLLRNGACAVIGSHPHVVQPYFAEKGRVVAYSLGNFVSNQSYPHTDTGLVVDMTITRIDNAVHCRAKFLPTKVHRPDYTVIIE